MTFSIEVKTASVETTVFWNASDYEVQDITSSTELGIMTIEATSDKKVSISSASATIEDISFTKQLARGGSGTVGSYRTMKFTASSAATSTLIFSSAIKRTLPKDLFGILDYITFSGM